MLPDITVNTNNKDKVKENEIQEKQIDKINVDEKPKTIQSNNERTTPVSPIKIKNQKEIEKINELPNSNNNNNHNSNVIPNRKKLFLPELHNNYNYQLPVINNINISMRKHPNINHHNINPNNYKYKIIQSNQQKINNLYKLYSPSMQRSIPMKYPRYIVNSNNNNSAMYIKSLENSNNYYRMYKPEHQIKMKKLSPIKKVINIY